MNQIVSHQEISELLPFYVNGSLDDAERGRVEAHLATCSACRTELAEDQRLLQAFRLPAASPLPGEHDFGEVMARVRRAPPPAPVARRRWGRRAAAQWTRRVAIVATLAAVGFGLVQFGAHDPAVATYHTLSRDAGKVVGADIIYVAFAPAASARAIDDALASVQGRVVSGPNQDHVVTVQVPQTMLAAAVASLEARPAVRFVAPAAPPATETAR